MTKLAFLVTFCVFLSAIAQITEGRCPFTLEGTPLLITLPDENIPPQILYNLELPSLDIVSVFNDIYDLMSDSQECFPADTFNDETSYQGLFLRLAWHCSGTYRTTDGLGGCTGGRQRYPPESAWDDNVNLDKARALLTPIKNKYGDALSWGDLFVFAGDAALLQGGGPITRVCAGRVDDVDGTKSMPLNDSSTCDENDENCQPPMGTSTVGLIYVNPEGVGGVPDPEQSAVQIREIFGRMGMNDSETVALVGGGHSFGKCHGACPNGPGPNPLEQPLNPWPGACGDNFPNDTYTSGFEGPWTDNPLQWDNEYFKLLLENVDDYQLVTGPGDKYQWVLPGRGLMMLTTDMSFMYDDAYKQIVQDYANDIELLNAYFDSAWFKLTMAGGQMANNAFCVDANLLVPSRK